jgi:hypothetical protein
MPNSLYMTAFSISTTVIEDALPALSASVGPTVRAVGGACGAAWRRPELKRLGSVAQVTAKVTNKGKWDGAFVLGMSRS